MPQLIILAFKTDTPTRQIILVHAILNKNRAGLKTSGGSKNSKPGSVHLEEKCAPVLCTEKPNSAKTTSHHTGAFRRQLSRNHPIFK